MMRLDLVARSALVLMIRIFVAIILAACFALLSESASAQVAEPIDQANISWFENKDIVACAQFSIVASQSCWVVADASSSHDLTNVLQGAFVGNMAASWIEERDSGYTLCALTANRTKLCEPISIAHVVGTKLSLAKSPKGGQRISLNFPKSGIKIADRRIIAQAFLKQYWEAKRTLVSKLNFASRYSKPLVAAGSSNSTRSKQFQSSKIVGITTNLIDCDGDECGGGGGGDGGGDGGGGEPPSDPGDDGGIGGIGGGMTNIECVKSCNNFYYLVLIPYCRRIASEPCYADAAQQYGSCLSTC